MKKWLVVFLFTLNILTMYVEGNTFAAEFQIKLDFGNSHRLDNLELNREGGIARKTLPFTSDVNRIDFDIYPAEFGIKPVVNVGLYLLNSFGFGWVLGGHNQNSDFSGDDLFQTFSSSNKSRAVGDLLGAHVELGYQFKFVSGELGFLPLVGYSQGEQNLSITDRLQTISTPGITSPIGLIENPDRPYKIKWKGPWVGIDLSYGTGEKITLFAGLEYHWSAYYSKVNRNRGNHLVRQKSLDHDLDFALLMISFGGEYEVAGPWSIILGLNYKERSFGNDPDQKFFPDISFQDLLSRGKNWGSLGIVLGITYRFHTDFS